MKFIHGLFFLLAMSLTIISCDSGTSSVDTPEKSTVKAQTTTPATPAKSEEGSTVKSESKEAVPNAGVVVEKTQKNEEAPVNDSAVDYKKLAASVCQCSSKFKGHDDGHVGDVHVSDQDTEYQKEVDCSMQAKNDMTTGEISRQKLVSAIKNQCHDIPGKLVMRLMMTLAK